MTIYQTQLGPIATNCYIVADEEKNAAVVDSGAEAARVKKILDDHQLRLRAVLLTHGHFDHIGGIKGLIEAFPDAEVVIGEKDAPMLAKKPGCDVDALYRRGRLYRSFRYPPCEGRGCGAGRCAGVFCA